MQKYAHGRVIEFGCVLLNRTLHFELIFCFRFGLFGFIANSVQLFDCYSVKPAVSNFRKSLDDSEHPNISLYLWFRIL